MPCLVHRPESVGLDAVKVKEYEDAMQELVDVGDMPGCASMVWRHGRLVQCGGWGFSDIRSKKRFTETTLCRVFCATKSLFSVCLFTLVDEGKLRLNDPLYKYIPAFKDIQVICKTNRRKTRKLKRPILLKHLLLHTSGIDYCIEPGSAARTRQAKMLLQLQQDAHGGKLRNLQEFVDRLATIPLSAQPGKKYIYGYSYDVISRVIEIVCGGSADKILYDRVLKPLQMQDTMWSVPASKSNRLGALYAGRKTYKALYTKSSPTTMLNAPGRKAYRKMIHNGKGMIEVERSGNQSMYMKKRACKIYGGGGYISFDAGGLVSTAADFAKFVKMLFNYGVMENGKRLLKESTVRQMELDRLDSGANKGDAGGYLSGGLAYIGDIGYFREGSRDIGMGGAANTFWHIDRRDGTATIWFSQHLDFPDFADIKNADVKKAHLWNLLHEARLPKHKLENKDGCSSRANRSSHKRARN